MALMGVMGIGQTLEATALPNPPANVMAAENVIGTQPYANLIIQLAQQPASSATGNNTMTAAQITSAVAQTASQLRQLSASQLQTTLAPYFALWSFLPTYLAAAPVVDAYNQQMGAGYTPETNPYAMVYNTSYGQAAQSYLQQLFQALGVTPPAQSSGGGGGTSTTNQLLSSIETDVTIGSLNVPVWALFAAVIGGLLVFGGGK